MVTALANTIILSNFKTECDELLKEVSIKIKSSSTRTFNFDMHNNYKIDYLEIEKRLNGIVQKFRKCEMNYHMYFDGMFLNVLNGNRTDLPIIKECIFVDGTAKVRKIVEVNDERLYQELIDYHFQEFVLFIASVIENLVYLAETLIRKVVVHANKQPPMNIKMQSYINILDNLLKLNYRTKDYISDCFDIHKSFFDKFLPTISTFRNKYIHEHDTRLINTGMDYILENPSSPLNNQSPEVSIDVFTETVQDNMRKFIPDFFVAITETIKGASHVPA